MIIHFLYFKNSDPSDKIISNLPNSQVLSVLHKHKEEPSVEGLLYDLYRPLLWRALDAANGEVRANAVSLFLDVFPLLPSSSNKVQIQNSIEEHCSKIKVSLVSFNSLKNAYFLETLIYVNRRS